MTDTLPRSHYECVTQLVSPEGVRVLVLGTAHISKRSVEDVQYLVNAERPDIVFLELCPRSLLLSLYLSIYLSPFSFSLFLAPLFRLFNEFILQ